MNENKPQSGTRHASLETLTLPEGHFRQNFRQDRQDDPKGALADYKYAAGSSHMQSALDILQGKVAKFFESFRRNIGSTA